MNLGNLTVFYITDTVPYYVWSAETGLFRFNFVNIMVADALAASRSSALVSMMLAIYIWWILLY